MKSSNLNGHATVRNLSHIFPSLLIKKNCIPGDSDPVDIYYCKKMVEHILLTFQEMEQKLHTSDFSKSISWSYVRLTCFAGSSLELYIRYYSG